MRIILQKDLRIKPTPQKRYEDTLDRILYMNKLKKLKPYQKLNMNFSKETMEPNE